MSTDPFSEINDDPFEVVDEPNIPESKPIMLFFKKFLLWKKLYFCCLTEYINRF